MNKVVVGLSGGVDSSVAAAVLHQQGYEVVGLTLWLMKGKGQCCSEGMVDAAKLCEDLGIPHHIVDSRDIFQTNIVDYLVAGYSAGITPLPCSQCNKAVKFSPMQVYAKDQLGIDRIATGHYARIHYDEITNRYQLKRAIDSNKDQSYFLYDLSQEILSATLFPLGEYTKPETRRIATELGVDEGQLRLVNEHAEIVPGLILKIPPKRIVAQDPPEIAEIRERSASDPDRGLVENIDVSNAPRAQLVRPNVSGGSQPAAASGKSYVVKSGDSIWRIANRYKVNQDALMKANGITDARKMKVGMNLVIP